MPEGLSPQEVGKEIAGHAEDHEDGGGDAHERHDRLVSIAEAVLLSIVALAAAWSGYAAAKWSTESRVDLAAASAARSKANRANIDAIDVRNFDASTFNAWFSAFIAHDHEAMALAERRFRPGFRVAFNAWRATDPEHNPNAPRGPTYMPQYRQPGLAKGKALDHQADEAFAEGAGAGERSDKYVRTTVFLASVLFLVGISTRFPLRAGRYALVALGATLLVVSVVLLAQLPRPAHVAFCCVVAGYRRSQQRDDAAPDEQDADDPRPVDGERPGVALEPGAKARHGVGGPLGGDRVADERQLDEQQHDQVERDDHEDRRPCPGSCLSRMWSAVR